MKNLKHIIALFIVLMAIVSIAYFIPKLGIDMKPAPEETSSAEATADTLPIQDTLPFIEKFKSHMEVVKSGYSKRTKRDYWMLGNGRTITNYLLQAQRFLNENGGKILYMEETYFDTTVFQAARFDALDPNGDSIKLTLQVSSNIFRGNASYLSIAFQVTQLTPELITALNELPFPYDLMITPFGMSDTFFPDLDRVKNKELILWLLMESRNLDSRHTKLRPIRYDHTDQQIEKIITDAKALVPTAKGVATRFAEQAMEHKQLLLAALAPIKSNGLWFIDLSLNQKTKVKEACKEIGIKCKILSPYNPSNSTQDDYINQKMRAAAKNGVAAIILPLTVENIEKVKSLQDRAANRGTTIVNLSNLMGY